MPRRIFDADELTRETASHLRQLRTHGAQARALHDRYRSELAAAYSDQRLSDTGRRERVQMLFKAFEAAKKKLDADTEAALDGLKAAHKGARITDPRDSSQALLQFQREQDGVERAHRMVAGGVPLMTVIKQAGDTGDTAMLAGLRRHLPADLAEYAARDPGVVAAHLQLIAQAEDPHLSDLERSVRAQEALLPTLTQAAQWNSRCLDNVVSSGARAEADAAHWRSVGDDGKVELIPVSEAPAGLPRL